MFHVAGREILSGPSRPLGTAWYKAEPKSVRARQESAGLIVPIVSSRNLGRGKEPCFSHGTRRRLGCPIAARLGTELTRFGTCSEPFTVNPSRSKEAQFPGT